MSILGSLQSNMASSPTWASFDDPGTARCATAGVLRHYTGNISREFSDLDGVTWLAYAALQRGHWKKKQDQWRQITMNAVGGTAYDINELIIVHVHSPYFRKKKRRLTRFVCEGK